MNLQKIYDSIPEFKGANFLIRIPLAIVFILQGLAKLPVQMEDAIDWGLPMTVWFFVAWGELFAGIGLIVGALIIFPKLWPTFGDIITRFAGITICGIMTGVILIGEPDSIIDVLLYDNFHVMLYCGGLFFALRGNRIYMEK